MPAPVNLSFETAGESPGRAYSWTLSSLSAAYEKPGFGAAVFLSPDEVDWHDVVGIGQRGRFVPAVIAPNGYFSFVFDLIVGVSANAIFPLDEPHDVVYFDDDNRLYYDSDAQKMVLRIGGVDLMSAALSWTGAVGLLLTAKHLPTGRSLTVAGATTGNGTVTAAALAAMSGIPRRGYVLGNPGAVETDFGVNAWTAENDPIDHEDFEHRWRNYYFDKEFFPTEILSQGFSGDSLAADGFEVDWGAFLRALALTAEAPFDAPPAAGPIVNYESFEQKGPWLLELASVSPAPFGVETFDPLGWDPDYSYQLGSVSAAAFAGAHADPAEDFERVFGPAVVTASPAPASELLWTGHPLVSDDRVGFETDGAFPLGLSEGILYYVVNPTSLSFQVSLGLAGTPNVIGDYGSGQLRVFGDPALYWVEVETF